MDSLGVGLGGIGLPGFGGLAAASTSISSSSGDLGGVVIFLSPSLRESSISRMNLSSSSSSASATLGPLTVALRTSVVFEDVGDSRPKGPPTWPAGGFGWAKPEVEAVVTADPSPATVPESGGKRTLRSWIGFWLAAPPSWPVPPRRDWLRGRGCEKPESIPEL